MSKKILSPDDERHGTANGYSNYKCRCARCREAWRVYVQEVLKPNRFAKQFDPDDERHGSLNLYNNYGCRCTPCTRAKRDHDRDRN
jgi:hypothetical protein